MDSLHAACVALGGAGVLIRGESGAGKSTLALLLADSPGGAFVADDRVRLYLRDGYPIAGAHPAEAGRVEIRGQGILCLGDLGLRTCHEAHLALVIDLVEAAPRLPDPPEPAYLLGVKLPRLVLDRGVCGAGLAPLVIRAALGRLGGVTSQPHTSGDLPSCP